MICVLHQLEQVLNKLEWQICFKDTMYLFSEDIVYQNNNVLKI